MHSTVDAPFGLNHVHVCQYKHQYLKNFGKVVLLGIYGSKPLHNVQK